MEESAFATTPGAKAPPSEMPTGSLAGQTICQYELLRELGRGGMGAVYLAYDPRLGRQVALKLLSRRSTSDAERVRRFRQEARAISTLNHPNILTIHEIGEAQTAEGLVYYIATEFVEGGTLRTLLRGAGLTLGELLDTAVQAAGALSAAHQAGIVHRDIKPENIMLRPDGLVKVLDFGLAKLTDTHAAPATPATFSTVDTDPGQLMGTISYMSPEQARGLEVDGRTDIFSLGVVLYELLTGRAPFAGATTGDVLVSILEREPPALQTYAPQMPAALQRIVKRALAKDCNQRYQQAAAFASELKELKQELELAANFKRIGDTLTGQPSLSLRVGQAAPGADAREAAAFTTKAAGRPTGKSRRLLTRLSAHRKGLALSVALLVLLLAGVTLSQLWRMSHTATGFDTLAVLPFVNVAADPELEYLADGLTESLMQNLQQQLPGLRVMARGTVFTYKGREVDPRQVGNDLKVRAIITGRVQRQGERLVIAAELADTSDGTQLWSERYQKTAADLQAVQAEIVREVTLKLRPPLRNSTGQPTAQPPAVNSEAYQLYLKGRYFQRQLTKESGEKALALFNQALALEPRFALPHSGIALVYQDFSSQYLAPREAIPKARQAALTALALDDQLAEAHFALAQAKIYDWDWAGAELEFKRTLALNPNFIDARFYYASALARLKRFAEAEAIMEKALELDPLSQQVCLGLGNIFYFARQYERARTQANKTLELDPAGFWASAAHRVLGGILLQQQHYQQGLAEYRQSFEISRTNSTKSWLAYAYAVAGQPREARALLRQLEAAAKKQWLSPVYLARVHIGLGELAEALKYLNQAYVAQSDHLVHISVDPVYDPLRNAPRFRDLLRAVGFTP